LDSLSRDDRDKHLITRGNVDGLISAAIFLNRYPSAKVSFVTSPRAGAQGLEKDRSSSEIFLVDIALIPDVLEAVATRKDHQKVFAVDHHPTSALEEMSGIKVVVEGMSAAGVLYHYLQTNTHLKKLVAIADLVEYCDTAVLRDVMQRHGNQKVDEESKILDFSWRLDIEDDIFRLLACKHLAEGIWPSQVSAIKRRYIQVVNEQRWPKAVARVKAGLRVQGPVGIFHNDEKNRSLYGFGTRALVEVATRRGCDYAMMVNSRRDSASVSLRGMSPRGLDVGRFVEDFISMHGMDGGGHPSSAGARIPLQVASRFEDDFVSAALTR
jgi:oligoribonuclease NrnB/cAMP/cGMP phosphodiesterase (DHH superfamily)